MDIRKSLSENKAQVLCAIGLTLWVLVSIGIVYVGVKEVLSAVAEETPVSPQQKAERHVAEADQKAQSAMDGRLKKLSAFFQKGKGGARAFAEEALSWSGKWAFVKGKVASGDIHEEFLNAAFSKHVFTGDDLTKEVDAVIKGFLIDLEDIESTMLVQLRADLADGPKEYLPEHLRSDEAFRKEYLRFREQAVKTLNADLQVTIGREVGLFVASDVAAQVAIRVAQFVAAELGVEAGILGAGAASSVATLGIGIVAAVIIDSALDTVFKMAGYDPAGEIAAKVRGTISNVEKVMVEGKGGLRQELETIGQARAALRKEIIKNLVAERGK